MNLFFAMLLIMFISFPVVAYSEQFQKDGGNVNVTVEYSSVLPGYVQIKDEECGFATSPDCEKARIRLGRNDCVKGNRSPGCREAEELLATSSCIPGLIYQGPASQGDKITVSLCKSPGGFGNIAVRNIRNGEIWTKYFLITDGNTVKYP